ncbi:unnamed protein product [Rhizophagus irregularis]|nr:unnamed protein product [Rhizophagus irregularis]CAB4403457.1 unnamed protein product [Rhizophagus irregularis]
MMKYNEKKPLNEKRIKLRLSKASRNQQSNDNPHQVSPLVDMAQGNPMNIYSNNTGPSTFIANPLSSSTTTISSTFIFNNPSYTQTTSLTTISSPLTNINAFTRVSDVISNMQSRYKFRLNKKDARYLKRNNIFIKRSLSPSDSEDENTFNHKRSKENIIDEPDTPVSGSKKKSVYHLPSSLR